MGPGSPLQFPGWTPPEGREAESNMNHDLKTWPEFFRRIVTGAKPFEVRRNDRNFALGDTVTLREYHPHADKYTGHIHMGRITYLLEGTGKNGIAPGYCVFAHVPLDAKNAVTQESENDPTRSKPERGLDEPVDMRDLGRVEIQKRTWPLGSTMRAKVIENTPVAQLLEDEHGEGHMILGGGRDLTAGPGKEGTMRFVAGGPMGAYWQFEADVDHPDASKPRA